MGYVPESQQDARWRIWNLKFQCRVTNIESMSVEYIKLHGMPSSGDPARDKEVANELVFRMLTIAEMLEYFEKGIIVRVSDIADTKSIYTHISDHLNAWKNQLENSMHTRGAPIDGLLLMDKFAQVVYAHAKSQFNGEFIESLAVRQISSVMRHDRSNILAPKVIESTTINAITEEDRYPKRASMSEIFASRLIASTPKWKK